MIRAVPAIAASLATALAMAGGLSACCATCKTQPSNAAGGAIDPADYTGEWTLRTIGGDDAAGLLLPGTPAPHITIAPDGGVTGFAGVNHLSTRFDASAATRHEPLFGPVITTKMAGPEPLMSLEYRFTEAVASAHRAEIDAGNLVLSDATGVALAVLTPTPR